MGNLDPSLEQGSSVWSPSVSKSIFLCVSGISRIWICVHCFYPATGNYWREPGSIFFTHSHPIFIHTDKMPLSFLFSNLFSKNSPSSPSLLYDSFSHLITFMAFHWNCSSLMFVTPWMPDLNSVLQECFTNAEWREGNLSTCGNTFLNITQKDAGHLCQHPTKFGLTEAKSWSKNIVYFWWSPCHS